MGVHRPFNGQWLLFAAIPWHSPSQAVQRRQSRRVLEPTEKAVHATGWQSYHRHLWQRPRTVRERGDVRAEFCGTQTQTPTLPLARPTPVATQIAIVFP